MRPLLAVLLCVTALIEHSEGHMAIGSEEAVLACVQPSVAADAGDVFVACGAGSTVYVSRAQDGGKFSPLARIAEVPGLALGRRRGPRIAVNGSTLVVSAIGKTTADGTTELWTWRSDDRGATWSGPLRVTDVPNAAEEGLHALAASRTTLALAWLDTRRGAMAVYGSTSTDGGATWTANAPLYARDGRGVCPCCHPSLTVDDAGVVTVMFRNDVEGNRDMYVKIGAAAAERLGREHWTIAACPMDGGGLAVDRERRPLTAWRRGGRVYVAAPGEREQSLGEGKDPAIVVGGGVAAVAWTAPAGLVLSTRRSAPRVIDPAGGFASLAFAGRERLVVLAWQSGDRSVVRRVELGL